MKKIIVISAVWCPSCLLLKKILKQIASDYPKLVIEMFDYDFDSEEIEKYNISNKLPVIIAFNDDIEVDRIIGEKNYDELIEFLRNGKII